jgi:hypothetical protein
VRYVADGVFRDGIDPVDIHLTISTLSFYKVSNRASTQQAFGHDMGSTEARASRRASAIDTVLRFVSYEACSKGRFSLTRHQT